MRYWRGWNRPISADLLGHHKTVVGFGLGVAAAVAVAFTQSRTSWVTAFSPSGEWLEMSLAQGIGAMSGDAIKSYFKRRSGIAPGERWIPADQLDLAVGALLLTAWLVPLRWVDVGVIVVITFFDDIVVNKAAYQFGIRDSPW